MQPLKLLGETKSSILERLATRPTTATQLAKNLRIQVSAVRKHLDQMERLGLIVSSFQPSGVGRPKKVYGITSEGKELFPRKYDTILNAALSQLETSQNGNFTESMLGGVAEGLATKSFQDAMGRSGFQATVEDKGDSFLVTSRNCPLFRTAEEHREVVCRGLHEEFLRAGLDGSTVKRDKWIVNGDPVCTHVVQKRTTPS